MREFDLVSMFGLFTFTGVTADTLINHVANFLAAFAFYFLMRVWDWWKKRKNKQLETNDLEK